MSIEAELQNTTMELVPEDEIVEPNDRMELQTAEIIMKPWITKANGEEAELVIEADGNVLLSKLKIISSDNSILGLKFKILENRWRFLFAENDIIQQPSGGWNSMEYFLCKENVPGNPLTHPPTHPPHAALQSSTSVAGITTSNGIITKEGNFDAQHCPIEKYIREEHQSFFYIDSSRLWFIQDTECTLRELVMGKLKQKNGFRRLLLGRKGVGKSTLLKCIAEAAKSVYSNKNLIVCSTSYISANDIKLPSTIIESTIGTSEQRSIQDLNGYLSTSNKFVLFIADELDSVFFSQNDLGQHIIGEIAHIGDSTEGRIHCIISGSSSRLRQLCFRKLPDEDVKRFPNYKCIDLNSTKFSARWIHPFLEKDDFSKVLRMVTQDGTKLEEADMTNIYIQTGGNARHISEIVRSPSMSVDSYSLSIKADISADEKFLLQAVLTCADIMPECDNELEKVTLWTRYVNLPTVCDQIKQLPEGGDITKLLYNLADRGLLRLNDHFDRVHYANSVSLGTPRIYMQLKMGDKCNLSIQEGVALLYPVGPLSALAEEVAMRFLIEKAEEWIRIETAHGHLTNKMLRQLELKKLNSMNKDDLVNCFWKELPDAYGTDAVFLENKDNRFVFHRIQLKLGKSRIEADAANKIVNTFSRSAPTIIKTYKECEIEVSELIYYLVTTRQLADEERKILEKGNVIIIGSEQLKNIWPDAVRSLGAPFK